MFSSNQWKSALLATVAAAGLAIPSAEAGQRRFVYNYETLTSPKGSIEFENWVTWKHTDKPGGDDKDVYQFRHEIEFGLTDRLQLGVYVADWEYNEDDDEGHSERYKGSGFEVIYNLTNPNTDLLGSALYAEMIIGERMVKLEGKLLLEKRWGNFGVVANTVLEAEWEGDDYHDETGEFKQTFGVSYDINKSFSVGAEAFLEIEMPDWEETESGRFYIGPNVSYRQGRFFGTLAWLWQTTHIEGEPDYQTRLIFGIDL